METITVMQNFVPFVKNFYKDVGTNTSIWKSSSIINFQWLLRLHLMNIWILLCNLFKPIQLLYLAKWLCKSLLNTHYIIDVLKNSEQNYVEISFIYMQWRFNKGYRDPNFIWGYILKVEMPKL